MTHDLLSGFSQLLTPEAIGLLIAGMAIGMFMGMLPGMGVSLALSLMLPFLYHMSVIPAITLMLATQAASYYAASITAILLNTPGAPESYRPRLTASRWLSAARRAVRSPSPRRPRGQAAGSPARCCW